MRGIVSRVSEKWYFEVGEACLCGHLVLPFYYAYVLSISSIVLQCVGHLVNVIFSFSSAVCIRWQGFAMIRVSCHCVIDILLFGLYVVHVNSNSNHYLFSELSSASTRVRRTRGAVSAHPLEFGV